jgi:hypothetical protein
MNSELEQVRELNPSRQKKKNTYAAYGGFTCQDSSLIVFIFSSLINDSVETPKPN